MRDPTIMQIMKMMKFLISEALRLSKHCFEAAERCAKAQCSKTFREPHRKVFLNIAWWVIAAKSKRARMIKLGLWWTSFSEYFGLFVLLLFELLCFWFRLFVVTFWMCLVFLHYSLCFVSLCIVLRILFRCFISSRFVWSCSFYSIDFVVWCHLLLERAFSQFVWVKLLRLVLFCSLSVLYWTVWFQSVLLSFSIRAILFLWIHSGPYHSVPFRAIAFTFLFSDCVGSWWCLCRAIFLLRMSTWSDPDVRLLEWWTSQTFIFSEGSTSLPGGNQVDGLPPASSL